MGGRWGGEGGGGWGGGETMMRGEGGAGSPGWLCVVRILGGFLGNRVRVGGGRDGGVSWTVGGGGASFLPESGAAFTVAFGSDFGSGLKRGARLALL